MKPKQNNWRKWPRDLIWLAGAEVAAIFAVALAIPFLLKRLGTIGRDTDAFERTPVADWFRVKVAATAGAPIGKAFKTIVPIDLPTIMPGWGVLPAVTGVENQSGAWNAVGQTRTVRLADDTTAREEITFYEAPTRFGYNVSDWSGALKFLAREAKSEWKFSEVAPGQTRIVWNYSFAPRSMWTAWLLWPIVQGLWRGAMKQALRECVRQGEVGA